jgi:Zn-dependent peptidase ImmA (M78 family)
MSAHAKRQALACASTSLELRKYVDASFRGLPPVDVPTLEGELDPEIAAGYVRARWGMDDHKPAANMVHLLEAHGVAVFSLPRMEATLDAFSFTSNRRPYVLLSTSKSAERSRFDTAHELGHLVLHGSISNPDTRDLEREANMFASSFLMPAIGVRRRVTQNPSLSEILAEKKHWRVAALALTYRLHALHLLSDWAYNNNILALGRQGYRNAEPGGIQRESSLLLGKVLRAVSGAQHLRGMCQQLGLAPDEVASFTFAVRPVVASSTPGAGETVKPADLAGEGVRGTTLRRA